MTVPELVSGMTYEEAGELILEDKPWVMCWECSGTGREGMHFMCSGCAGFKVILVRGYRTACQLLDKPLPTPPPIENLDLPMPGGAGGQGEAHVYEYDS